MLSIVLRLSAKNCIFQVAYALSISNFTKNQEDDDVRRLATQQQLMMFPSYHRAVDEADDVQVGHSHSPGSEAAQGKLQVSLNELVEQEAMGLAVEDCTMSIMPESVEEDMDELLVEEGNMDKISGNDSWDDYSGPRTSELR